MTEFAETNFATKTDAIEQSILPALGEYADDFDIDGIFDDCFTYEDGYFVPREGVDFWEVAEKHDISGK